MSQLTHRLSLAIVLLLSFALSACDSGDPSDASGQGEESLTTAADPTGAGEGIICEAGAVTGCICDNGYLGTKSCESSGESFGACTCETCTPSCEGMTCGGDGCGGSCGTCFGDDICKSGTCKFNTQCPVGGTGTLVGDQIKNVTFTGAHALPLELHSMCGEAKAIWITLVAGWCTACTTLAPNFHAIHEQFIEEDVDWLLLVGDDGGYNPADWNYAKQYHSAKGYPETWKYVADPSFQQILDAVQLLDAEGSLWLPAHLVIGSDMSIQFISSPDNSEIDAMTALQSML